MIVIFRFFANCRPAIFMPDAAQNGICFIGKVSDAGQPGNETGFMRFVRSFSDCREGMTTMKMRGKWCAPLLAAVVVCAQAAFGSVMCFAQTPGPTNADTSAAGAAGYCVVTAQAQPAEGGSVKGGGVFRSGDTATLTAEPEKGWKFAYWEAQEQGAQSQYGGLADRFVQPVAEISDIFKWASSSSTAASSGKQDKNRVYSTECVLRVSQNVTYVAYFEKDGAAAQAQDTSSSGKAAASQAPSSQTQASSSQAQSSSSQAVKASSSQPQAASSQAVKASSSQPQAPSLAPSAAPSQPAVSGGGLGVVSGELPNSTRNITLRYVAEEGGTIEGVSNQQIPVAGNGKSVQAKAKPGYKFISWSDGLKTASRQDMQVEESKTVTALFESTVAEKNETAATTTTQPKTGDDFPRTVLFGIALMGVCLSVFFLRRYQDAKAGG